MIDFNRLTDYTKEIIYSAQQISIKFMKRGVLNDRF